MSGVPWGGSEELWQKTAIYAKTQNHEVLASVFDWGKLHPRIIQLKDHHIKIHLRKRFSHNIPLRLKIGNYIKNRISIFDKTYIHILNFKPDTVVINQGGSFDISIHHFNLYKILNSNKIPYILISHNHSQYSDLPEKNIYPQAQEIFLNAKSVFFVSNRMKQLIERRLCCDLKNAIITWNPLNLMNYNYIEYPKIEIIQFAIVGGLLNSKGQDTALNCFSSEEWKTRKWILNIYGDGYGENYLKDLAGFYKISNNVVFHGYTINVEDIWKINHMLLIPSSGEGLPISLCEAMICGRPAVVTDIGGNTEMITENVTGFVAEAPSVFSFSHALERAWNNKDKWKDMGLSAHKTAMERIDFSPEKQLLKKLLS
jgi:L-malate glycosyltransferase